VSREVLCVRMVRRIRTITIAIEPYRHAFKIGVITQLIEDSGSNQDGHVI
jgi:hypothetical protein